MKPIQIERLKLRAEIEQFPCKVPFRITGYTFEVIDVVTITLEKEGYVGRGEATGVYYRKDTPASMLEQIENAKTLIEAGVSRDTVQTLLPAGGARNALDCAVWDLEAKIQGIPAWKLAGLEQPRKLITTFTCGAEPPEVMAATARGYANARAIKVKLTGEPIDADRVRAIRAARPDVWLGVDGNQGFKPESLQKLMPVLIESNVKLIEQPFPIGKDEWLDGLNSPIPVAADESVQTLKDIAPLVGRVNVINIKLDKSGGLTEGLAMARAARAAGLEVMVGNMMSTSLSMAPAFLVGQLCQVVDLDGPALLKTDRKVTVDYTDGYITCPPGIWGDPS